MPTPEDLEPTDDHAREGKVVWVVCGILAVVLLLTAGPAVLLMIW